MRRNLCLGSAVLSWLIGSAIVLGQDPSSRGSAEPPRISSANRGKLAQAEDDKTADEFKRLAGNWTPKKAVIAGNDITENVRDNIQLELTPERFKTVNKGSESQGSIKLDVTTEPRAMDITLEDGPEAGKTIKCIYKLEDELLHVAYSLSFDDVRPVEFESNQDNKLLLIVYQRSESSTQSPPRQTPPANEADKE